MLAIYFDRFNKFYLTKLIHLKALIIGLFIAIFILFQITVLASLLNC
jgi:hypothetical protein